MRSCKTCRHTLGEEHCRGCNYSMGLHKWEPKPMTNADRIRSMTDEDLMRFLLRVGTLENRPWCDDEPCNNRYCSECITEWLKKEVRE